MKKIIVLIIMVSLFVSSVCLAQDIIGCICPKAKIKSDGNLDRIFINIYFKPSENSGVYIKIAAPLTLTVVERQGNWLKVVGTTGSPFKEDEELGWVKKSDVQDQHMRNCH